MKISFTYEKNGEQISTENTDTIYTFSGISKTIKAEDINVGNNFVSLKLSGGSNNKYYYNSYIVTVKDGEGNVIKKETFHKYPYNEKTLAIINGLLPGKEYAFSVEQVVYDEENKENVILVGQSEKDAKFKTTKESDNDKQGTFSNISTSNTTYYNTELDWRFKLPDEVQAENDINVLFKALDQKGNAIILEDTKWNVTPNMYGLSDSTEYTLWAVATYLVDGKTVYTWSNPYTFKTPAKGNNSGSTGSNNNSSGENTSSGTGTKPVTKPSVTEQIQKETAKAKKQLQKTVSNVVSKISKKKAISFRDEFAKVYSLQDALTKKEKAAIESYKKKIKLYTVTKNSKAVSATNLTNFKTKKSTKISFAAARNTKTLKASNVFVIQNGQINKNFKVTVAKDGKSLTVLATKSLKPGTYTIFIDNKGIKTIKGSKTDPIALTILVK